MSAEAAAAGVRRPSPRPRPDTGPRLTVVPHSNSEVPTSAPTVGAGVDPITAGQSGSRRERSERWFRTWASRTYAASRDYWTPPALFTDPPASLADLAAYARTAPWTHQNTGVIRGAGVGYYRFVAYPKTVLSRYSEWVWQRPLRLAMHLAGIKLFAHTPPGMWLVDHLIYPGAHLAGHIFL